MCPSLVAHVGNDYDRHAKSRNLRTCGDLDDLWLRDSAAQVHTLMIPIHGGKSLVATIFERYGYTGSIVQRAVQLIAS